MTEKQDPDYKKAAQENPRLDPSKPYPLEGVLVVDLTRVLSGPTCTRMLADAGARVIHVERPPKGDDTRSMGPYVADGSSDYFRIANVGKESIALDFRNPDDHAFLMKMIAKADVVVENFRPGVMAKNGLDPEDLVKKFPRLIVCSISGFGQWGPMSQEAAYDTVIQAWSGLMDLTGLPADEGGLPTRVGTSISDIVAGIHGYAGIVTALYAREKTGKGTTVDISMLDTSFSLMAQGLMSSLGLGQRPKRIGNRHPYMYPFDTFMCADEMVAICCGNDRLWGLLSACLGHPEWAKDPDMATNDLREKNWKKVKSLMEGVLSSGPAEEWQRKISEAGVPCGLCLNVDDTRRMPQIVSRGMVKEMPDGQLVLGDPFKYGTWNSYGAKKDAPSYDENSKEIREEFGASGK